MPKIDPSKKPVTAKKPKVDPILAAIQNIEKQMGNKTPEKFIIKRYGDRIHVKVECISFGDDEVDKASNCGGVPRGKMIEIFGPESGGKSLLSLKLIASAQKMGLACCLIDAEQSFDPKWAATHGVDVDNLYIIDDIQSAEVTLDYVDAICASGKFGLVVIDSTAALVPQKELEGSIGDQDYALLARALSKGCRKIMNSTGKAGTTCVFINQIREKMGVMFGDNKTTPGGRALKFYCHQRISVTPGSVITVTEGDKKVVVARKSYVKFVKNKVARPFGSCEMTVIFDQSALNPVVKLCNIAKASDFKAVRTLNGEFTISKEIVDEKKNLQTGAMTMVDLAKYVVEKNLVIPILEYIKGIKDGDPSIETVIPPDVMAMLEDPSLIVAPGDTSKPVVKTSLVSDGTGASEKEIAEESGEADGEVDIGE